MDNGRNISEMNITTIVTEMLKIGLIGAYYESTYTQHTRLACLFYKNPQVYEYMEQLEEG